MFHPRIYPLKNWTEINPAYSPIQKHQTIDKVVNAQIVVCDLDGTAAKSPSIEIALKTLLHPDLLLRADYRDWVYDSALKLIIDGRRAYSGVWRELTNLLDEGYRQKIGEHYVQIAQKKVYPGFKELIWSFEHVEKRIIVTQNLPEVAEAFRRVLRFDDAYPLAFDKGEAIAKIRANYPDLRRFLLFFNSSEDMQMPKALQELRDKGHIESVVSVYVTNVLRENPQADINSGRKFFSLIDLCRISLNQQA